MNRMIEGLGLAVASAGLAISVQSSHPTPVFTEGNPKFSTQEPQAPFVCPKTGKEAAAVFGGYEWDWYPSPDPNDPYLRYMSANTYISSEGLPDRTFGIEPGGGIILPGHPLFSRNVTIRCIPPQEPISAMPTGFSKCPTSLEEAAQDTKTNVKHWQSGTRANTMYFTFQTTDIKDLVTARVPKDSVIPYSGKYLLAGDVVVNAASFYIFCVTPKPITFVKLPNVPHQNPGGW